MKKHQKLIKIEIFTLYSILIYKNLRNITKYL